MTKPSDPGYWGKLDILLRPIGGLATAGVVAFIGYLGSDILQERQQMNAKVQLYAQIMSSREAAETGLRREMFNSIIQTFLRNDPREVATTPEDKLEQRILAVQLLTYNFHDALDLGPLFKYLGREAEIVHEEDDDALAETLERLKRTARDVVAKQIAVLESDGETKAEIFELNDNERGMPKINQVLPEIGAEAQSNDDWSFMSAKTEEAADSQSTFLPPKNFRVEMLSWDDRTEEVRVRLMVSDPKTSELEFDEVFWVGSFDFPLIDNTRLKGGGRCAVVLQKYTAAPAEESTTSEIESGEVKLNLIYFHGSRASLKSRPYYDEVIKEAIGKGNE